MIIDGNNVMGTRPDGWWRDRRGAVLRMLARLQLFAGSSDQQVVLVLDYPHPDLEPGLHGRVEVAYPQKPGRDGADRHIVKLVDEMDDPSLAEVVTSDRWLRHQVEVRRGRVVGSKMFLQRLESMGL